MTPFGFGLIMVLSCMTDDDYTYCIGEAQRHYMRAEYKEALRLCNEILCIAPNVPDPYQLMGQIHEDQRELQRVCLVVWILRACRWPYTGSLFHPSIDGLSWSFCTCMHYTHPQAAEINLIGCQFGPKDAALWKKTGQMFLELGKKFYLKAQYCFGRAIKVRHRERGPPSYCSTHTCPSPFPLIQLNKKDIEAIADRAHVQSLWGKVDKAVLGYEQILRLNPPQPDNFLIRMADECLRKQ